MDVMADNWMLGAGLIAASGIVAGLNGYLGASEAETKITESPANSISYSAKGDVFGKWIHSRGPYRTFYQLWSECYRGSRG